MLDNMVLKEIVSAIWERRQQILILFVILSILFRIFSIFVVPEPAYNDSIYHLEIAQELMSSGQITKEMPPFLYHLILAGFFGITGLSIQWPFVKIIPLIVTITQIVIAYLLFKQLFPKNYCIPLLFFTAFPWAVRIGSVNMPDSFSILTVLLFTFCFYFLTKSFEKKESLKWSFLTTITFVLMAFSKTNVIFILPILLLGFAMILKKKLGNAKAIIITIIAGLFSVSFIIISLTAPASTIPLLAGDISSVRSIPLPRLDLITPQFFPISFATFFDFPAQSAFSKINLLKSIPYEISLSLFILLMIPLGWAILSGTKDTANKIFQQGIGYLRNENNIFWITVILAFLVSFYPGLTIIRQDMLYVRYMLPALPFVALIIANAFNNSREEVKKIIFLSLIIFSIYSFAMTSTSAINYQNIQQRNSPLYEFINESNDINSLISMENARALRYYTNSQVIQIPMDKLTIDELIAKYPDMEYVAILCYNETIPDTITDIFSSEKAQIIFEQDCTKLIKINN
jgi:hypothetical protein